MRKTKIQIIKLGKQANDKMFDRLKKYKSKLFEVDIFEKSRPNCDLDWGYTFNTLERLLSDIFDKNQYDICIGFIDTSIERNYFGKRLKDDNIFIISFYNIDEVLKQNDIDVFNYMLLTIYRYLTRYKLSGMPLTHDETKSCIFDMCGNKKDIIYLCSKPSICSDCESVILKNGISSDYIHVLKREIQKIKKSKYYAMRDLIKRYPFFALIVGVILTFLSNLASNFLYAFIIKKLSDF